MDHKIISHNLKFLKKNAVVTKFVEPIEKLLLKLSLT